jgi:23S rRNA (cytosine1962-C5)-methyltransferase
MTPARAKPDESAPARPAPVASSADWPKPWVQLKYFTYHPSVYPRFINAVSPGIKRGQLATVYDRDGLVFGAGFFNPTARVPLRMMHHGQEPFAESDFPDKLRSAANWRTRQLKLDAAVGACRVVHSDGDGLSGLIVDRYADVLRIDVHSYGVWQRLDEWIPILHEAMGTQRHIVTVDPDICRIEGIPHSASAPPSGIRTVKIQENSVRYLVHFEEGHKTGFFCDQRDNRRQFASLTEGMTVLDLCCYTGGFSLAAKVLGGAGEVTGVDLDESAIELARQNANLNQTRVNWVHADAFKYARQMQQNARTWDAVVLDPPKLVFSRTDEEGGRRKYEDLNRLAVTLVRRGGLFVTCSCSGLLSAGEFEHIVIKAAHREGRRLQFFDRSGAGPDHPVMSNCPESEYLKVLWARVH